MDTRDHKVLPTRGVYWNTNTKFNYSLSRIRQDPQQFISDLGLLSEFPETQPGGIALRLGGAINTGDYQFYQAASIGGNSNLRGHRADRYSGDASIVPEYRIAVRLFNFSTYFAKGEFGVIGFNDIGRVWLEEKIQSYGIMDYGGGLWLSPFRYGSHFCNIMNGQRTSHPDCFLLDSIICFNRS